MRITIRVKAGSKVSRVEKDSAGMLVVAVKAPAREGKANEAVIEALAKHFDVRRSQVTIVSGLSAKLKIIEITS